MTPNSVEKSSQGTVAEIGTNKSYSADAVSTHSYEDSSSDRRVQTQTGGLKGHIKNFCDGFKIYKPELGVDTSKMTELEKANVNAASAPLKRKLKSRHIQMISIGSAIGTGLFVGAGSALSTGGPASVIICYFLVGAMIFSTVQALGELAVAFPVAGSFLPLCSRFLSPAWGFTIAWNYAMQWFILLPLELVAASMTIKYWNTSVNSSVWVTVFFVVIMIINIFGVRGYAEVEFILSFVKVIAIVGFAILGIILNCGGGPVGGYIGAKYFYNPGAFANGFKGFCSVFVTAAFSFAGTELVGLTSAETENPAKTLPTATKQVFWRITLFYIVSLTLIGLLVPYNDKRLLGASSSDANASPFVIAIENAHIKVLPSIFNGVILVSILSVANSAVFACSRTLASLADQSFAPKCFGYIDRRGRPLISVGISLLFGLLSYLAASPKEDIIFTWLMALSGLSSICTWAVICLSHIRFRRAMTVQGRSLDELRFKSICGVTGSYLGFALNIVVLIVEFWISLFPLGADPSAQAFFENYISIVVNILFIIGYILWKRRKTILWIRAKDIDLTTGRTDYDAELNRRERAERNAYLHSKPWWYRVYKFWC